jgi:hypothetical protein
MKIYKKILVINKFTLHFCKSDDILKREILNCNLRKVSFHLFKSDFLILIFINFNIYLIYILSKIFGKTFFKVYKLLFNFFYTKFKEILISSIFINNFNYTEKYQTKNFIQVQEYFDYIVIGSGPSGSITSYYLNKKFPGKTLLLEKGKDISNFNRKHPHDEFLKKWKNAGLNSTLFPMQISFASGECLGGGSEINSGLFHKPSKKFMTSWEERYAFKPPSQEEINNHFREINEITKSDKIKPLGKSCEYFLKGCDLTNEKYEHIPQFYSMIDHSSFRYRKNSMRSSYIDLYIKDLGKIQTGFDASKIEYLNNKNYWSIEGKMNGKKKVFNCKTLFLSCGAMETSKLLINSKIYSKKVSSFKFHPMIKLVVEFENKVQEGYENVHPYQITNNEEEFIIGEASSGPQFIKMNFINDSKLLKHAQNNWNKMSVYHCTFSFGDGTIKKFPFIEKFFYCYKIDKSNVGLIKKTLIKTCQILFSGGAKKIYLNVSGKINQVNNLNYNEVLLNLKKPSDLKFSSVHIMGGIKSGENKNCIVNSYGKLKNYENLFINDSSLLNNNLLRNPQGTIMLIAKRNIQNFLNEKKYNI